MGRSSKKNGNLGTGKKKRSDIVLPSASEESNDTQSTSWTFGSVGTGNWTAATLGTNYTGESAYLETILRGDDLNYVQQKYGNMSIVISIIQLFTLVMILALCGVAPITINPAIGPYPDALSYLGSTNSYAMFRQFQFWRILTSPFISAGILHFLCVVGIQLELGAFFEREWGSSTWLFIYMMSAIGSTLCDGVINTDGISVGITGPLVGLFGAKVGEIIMMMSFRTKDAYLVDGMHQLTALSVTLFFTFLLVLFPYVGWGGHIGGLLTGFITGMIIFSEKIKHRRDRKIWSGSGLILGVLTFFLFIGQLIESSPNNDLADVCEYYENMHPENYECNCAL